MGRHATVWFVAVVLALAIGARPAAAAPVRGVQDLDAGWRFIRADVAGADQVRFDDRAWSDVNLPHTWNTTDGDDGGGYYRGAGWYRLTFTVAPAAPGARRYLEFDGATLAAELWVNGAHVGRHDGGFARFRFDVTPWLKTGRNVLAVRVDNSPLPDVAPLSGDFTIFGGIDRDVRLVTTAPVHFDMLDYGSSGVRFRQSGVTRQSASLGWTARVANDRDQPAGITVTVHLLDAGHHEVATVSRTATVAAHAVTPVDLNAVLAVPHLWQGTEDSYLYTSTVEVRAGGSLTDSQTFQVGLRDIRFDAARGVTLNGRPYGVHGVDVHQVMRPGRGPAVTPAEVDADFRILQDLGVTGLRFAHYQHPPREYDLADRMGILVWTEVPNVGDLGPSDGFAANAVQQMRELIRQNENHASVMVWGLGNELHRAGDKTFSLLDRLAAVAHEEDPSRPTTYANCCGPVDQAQATHSDLLGANVYFGWYSGEFGDLAPWYAGSVKLIPGKPLAISEYGAGASAIEQEDPPRRPKTTSAWHPEQYQALYHEAACRQTATWIKLPESEDCLYLNVWAPAVPKGEKLPVMVWIHGGGYYGGTAAQPLFDGAHVARHGVIVVTLNYRLGVFGFFSHPELAAEGKVDGNQGLLDQVAALKWVKHNIAAFGGDPNRVTIFGESAGGESVAVLETSPLARGLFQRAIAESGNMAMPIDEREYKWFDRPAAEAEGVALGKALNAPHLADLRKLDTETVIKPPWSPHPVVDAYLIPADMTKAYASGQSSRVPLLVGWNADEGKDLAPEILGTSDFSLARYPGLVAQLLGREPSKALLETYPATTDAGAKSMLFKLTTDYWSWRMWKWARLHTAAPSGPAYVYDFVHIPAEPATPCGYGCGAGHGAEIPYVFDQLAQDPRAWSGADHMVAQRMVTYWTNFAKTGNPNGPGLPAWKAFDGSDASVIRLGSDTEVKAAPSLPDYRLIDGRP